MAVRRFSTSSIRTGVKTSRFWDQSTVLVNPAFESIATISVGSGGVASVTFDNIPSTYTHLQVRVFTKWTGGTGSNDFSNLLMSINNDSGTNYARHELRGNGASVISFAATNESVAYVRAFIPSSFSGLANVYGGPVIDILDYKDTNKFKTVRALGGFDGNGYGLISLASNLWRSTSAITKLVFQPDNNNFAQYSHFALYGIKVAS